MSGHCQKYPFLSSALNYNSFLITYGAFPETGSRTRPTVASLTDAAAALPEMIPPTVRATPQALPL